MKIIILSPSDKNTGGVERFCFSLKDILSGNGDDVKIMSPKKGLLSMVAKKIALGVPYDGWALGKRAWLEKYDLVITNGALGWNLKDGHIINIQHGTFAAAAERIDKSKNLIKWLIKRLVWGYFEKKAAEHGFVVAVSGGTADSVKKYYKVRVDAIIPNGIDVGLFKKRDKVESRKLFNLPLDRKIVAFDGRFEYGKGSDVLEAMIPEFIKNSWVLAIATNYTDDVPLSETIRTFPVAYEELPYFYSSADVFVFPSRHEGCSYALMGAMSCEVSVVSSAVAMEATADRSIPFWDISSVESFIPSDFYKKIQYILSLPPDKTISLGREERSYVEKNRSMGIMRDKYVSIVNSEMA